MDHTPSPKNAAVWNVALYGLPVLYVLWLRFGLPVPFCDDALITMSAVRNFAEGEGLWFDPRQRVQIVTGPLWALPVAFLRALGMDVLTAATLFGALFDVIMVLAITHLGRLLSGWTGLGMVAAVLAAMNPHVTMLASFRGMETSLSIGVIAASFIAFFLHRNALALLLGVVAVMARFDGLLALGCVGLAWMYRQRKTLIQPDTLRELVPAGVLALLYGSVGWWFAGSPIPWSVERKSSVASPEFLGEQWVENATKIATKFWDSSIGIVEFHTRHDPPTDAAQFGIDLAYWMGLPAVIGLLLLLWKRQSQWLPVVGYGLFFASVFTVSGKVYALHSPWYFAPTAFAFTLLVAYGLVAPMRMLFDRVAPQRAGLMTNGGAIVLGLLLMGLQQERVAHSAKVVNKYSNKRERAYAAATIWFGENVSEKGFLVANEIGAVGFWARQDQETLDYFGLSRRYEERYKGFGVLVETHKPLGAIMLAHADYPRRAMNKRAPGEYVWHEWKRLIVGVRKDIAPTVPLSDEVLASIHEEVSMSSEYVWEGEQ